jgi:uncharacterized RDD family membrane protein YckC
MIWTKMLRIGAFAVVAFQVGSLYVFPGVGGGAREWSNGATTVSATSSSVALAWSLLGILLFVILMTRNQSAVPAGVPAWWRRAGAFFIDFHFGVITLAGVATMVALVLEAEKTGHFVWNSQPRYSDPTEFVLLIPLTLLFMAVLFLYFAFPLTRGKQTVGCFVMRIKVTPPFGTEGCFTWPGAVRRTWYEFRGLGRWTSLLKPKRDADGNTWYDIESGCHVALVNDGSA